MGNERLPLSLSGLSRRTSYNLALIGLLFCLTSCSHVAKQSGTNSDAPDRRGFACCPLFSQDSRYVTFSSTSSNLVPDDTNEEIDSFVFDIVARQLTRLSYGFDGSQSNDGSGRPAVSSGGRYAAFMSDASNLLPDDMNEVSDAFLYDRESGLTERIPDAPQLDKFSPFSAGSISISADGRRIAFRRGFRAPGGKNDYQVFVFDLTVGATHAVSLTPQGSFPNDWADHPAISPDGRYVAFTSNATDLASNAGMGQENLFIHELAIGKTKCITCIPAAPRLSRGGPSFSGDSRFLAYRSRRYGGVAIFDLEQNLYLPPLDLECDCSMVTSDPSVSLDGRFIAFEARVNRPLTTSEAWFERLCTECGVNASQHVIFVHDRDSGVTTRVFPVEDLNWRSDVHTGHPVISPDGRYVAFDNLVKHSTESSPQVRDIVIYDRETGESIIVTAGNGTFEWSK